jgi:hypothetical protein
MFEDVTIKHVRLKAKKDFGKVRAALEGAIPALPEAIPEMLTAGDSKRAAVEHEHGPPLYIFHSRDHGSLLAAFGGAKKAIQYDIGNPITASLMTRHKLAAGLYAPIRVFLYDEGGRNAVFEYDLPSTTFGQFGDPDVLEIARGLDQSLEAALVSALR